MQKDKTKQKIHLQFSSVMASESNKALALQFKPCRTVIQRLNAWLKEGFYGDSMGDSMVILWWFDMI